MIAARVRLTLIAATMIALAAVAGVLLAMQTHGNAGDGLVLTNGWAGAERPPGLPVPNFALKDSEGKIVTSASLKGHPVVFAFVYSTCRDTCPAQVQTIRGALDDLKRKDVEVIGVSVDPLQDTPKRATSFMLEQGMLGRMKFLLGTREQLAPVWKGFGIQPQLDGLEHSAHTVLADPTGLQRIGFPYDDLTPEGLAHDLAKL